MKLEELMNQAFDEVWFCIVEPDGEEHYVWNADYLGWHPDVMHELEPLLAREFEDFSLVMRDDPESEDAMKADKVPMVYVPLLKKEDELNEEKR